MVHIAPETNGCKQEPDDNDTVKAFTTTDSETQAVQRKDDEFVLQFAGRLSFQSSDSRRSTAFQQDWRTVADPSFEHLTFGTRSTSQQADNSTGDDSDAIEYLACPFRKHNPAKYKDWKCCNTWNGWPTVHRIKEHLYRKHLLPENICPRCGDQYQSVVELAVHLRADSQYEKRNIEPHDGVDAATEKKLRMRVREANLSEEAKWTKLYKLLFPQDTSTPSPFHERSMAEYKASLLKEFEEHLCSDFSRLWRPRFMEMLTSNCNENNGVPDPEKVGQWMQDFVLESMGSFAATSTTSGYQKTTKIPGLASQTSSLLGYSSHTSFQHNQQIIATPSESSINPQLLSSFWENSPSIGVNATQFNVDSFFSAHPPSGIE